MVVLSSYCHRPSLQMAVGCPTIDLSPVPNFWLRLSHPAITSMVPSECKILTFQIKLSKRNVIPWITPHASFSSELSASFNTAIGSVPCIIESEAPPLWPMSHMYK